MDNNEEETRARRAGVRMWPGVTAGVVIGLIAFVLSFDALRLVFVACGINPWLSWGGPVCVDGTILLCTWATWGFRKGHIRGGAYPWLGLVAFSLFSIAGNALHAVLNTGYQLPAWVAPAVMSIPPVALLYSTHLIVIIAGDRLDKINTIIRSDGDAAAATPAPVQPAPAGPSVPDVEPAPVPERRDDGPRTSVDATEGAGAWTPTFEPSPEPAAAESVGITEPVIAGIPDLRDWMVPVPPMGDDAFPKAVEADAPVADASEPEPAEPAVTEPVIEPVTREDVTVPALAIQADSTTIMDGEPEGPVQTEPAEPRPAEAETEPAEAEPAGKVGTKRGRGRAAEDDAAWLDWLDAMAAKGGHPSAAKAVEAGLAASTSTAKRHLARLRKDRPERFERFEAWKA